MRAACKEAAKYGEAQIPIDRNPTLVTVILNPVANKRKAKQDFERYCEPLLHLAGLQVDVIQTAAEGNAKEIVETLKGTEAIIVAGGDGTLSETVTGKSFNTYIHSYLFIVGEGRNKYLNAICFYPYKPHMLNQVSLLLSYILVWCASEISFFQNFIDLMYKWRMWSFITDLSYIFVLSFFLYSFPHMSKPF